jgi:inorganic pyrophosphatase
MLTVLYPQTVKTGKLLEDSSKRRKNMADFNKVLTPGDIDGGVVNVVIEIPKGSSHKIEWNRELALFQLDRVEPNLFAKPVNYGFIPQTLDEDGDELDALIITDEPLPTGVFLEATVIGVFKFEDGGEVDDKIVVVPTDDRNSGDLIKTFDDLTERWKQKIEHHFTHYKDLKKPGTTIAKGWGDANEAKRIIHESVERWNNK